MNTDKILVISDSHTDTETMVLVTAIETPDVIFHLGDHTDDTKLLKIKFPHIPMYSVAGNTDQTNDNLVKFIEIGKHKIMYTHGHTLFDTDNYDFKNLFMTGVQNHADIILFGHTHELFINKCDTTWLINPGRIGRRSNRLITPTYCVLYITDETVKCTISEIK